MICILDLLFKAVAVVKYFLINVEEYWDVPSLLVCPNTWQTIEV